MDMWPVHGAPSLSHSDSWRWQPAPQDMERKKQVKKMIRWKIGINVKYLSVYF